MEDEGREKKRYEREKERKKKITDREDGGRYIWKIGCEANVKDAEIRIKAKGDIGGEKMAKNNRRER